MKRIAFILVIALQFLLCGCSKEDDGVIITNLSGKNWYDAQVWFRETEGGELKGYEDVGMVTTGSNCIVYTSLPYFYIYAKDNRGRMIMSKDVRISGGKATITEKDLFQ